jgi:DNA-binding CsgD family transcriptional regulator
MDEHAVLHLTEIAASAGTLQDRGLALLGEIRRHVDFDSAWLSLADSSGTRYSTVASDSLDPQVEAYLSGPENARDIELTGTNRDRPPLSISDLPYPAEDLATWADCLVPAGYHEALAVPLFADGARQVGFLALLSSTTRPPTQQARDDLGRTARIIARGVDPMVPLAAAARVVQGATAGVVLARDGGTTLLPGLPGDALLSDSSGVLSAAAAALRSGQAYSSFLWPRGGRHAPDGHVRVTVVSAMQDLLTVCTGMVLLSDAEELHGLTPRELEVLGLLVAGCSNQEIAAALVVTPRTVAAHVEHILHKLDAPSRTLAAVRAQRTGTYVPAGAAAR